MSSLANQKRAVICGRKSWSEFYKWVVWLPEATSLRWKCGYEKIMMHGIYPRAKKKKKKIYGGNFDLWYFSFTWVTYVHYQAFLNHYSVHKAVYCVVLVRSSSNGCKWITTTSLECSLCAQDQHIVTQRWLNAFDIGKLVLVINLIILSWHTSPLKCDCLY